MHGKKTTKHKTDQTIVTKVAQQIKNCKTAAWVFRSLPGNLQMSLMLAMPLLRGPCRFSVAWLLLHGRPSRPSPLPHGEKAQSSLQESSTCREVYIMRANSIWSTRSVPYVLFGYLFFFTNKTFPIFNIPEIYTVMQAKQIPARERIRSVKGSENKTSQNWLQQLSLLEGHVSFAWICR